MKALVVGYGSIGKRHAEILSEVDSVESVHVITKQTDIGYCAFSSIEEVPNLSAYDYFVIASETAKHYGQLNYLCNNVSNKKILVEKPVFHEKIEISNAKKNTVRVAYNLRFHPICLELKNKLLSEKVLAVTVYAGQFLPLWRPEKDYRLSYSASKSMGGGVLLDLSHEIDYLLWLFGGFSLLHSVVKKVSGLEIDTEDVATGIGETNDGAVVSFFLDYLCKFPFRLLIVHTEKSTFMGDFVRNTMTESSATEKIKNEEFDFVDRNYTYQKMHESFIGGRYETLTTLDEGLDVLQVIDSMKRQEMSDAK